MATQDGTDPTPGQQAVPGASHGGDAFFAQAYPELRQLARARLRDGGRGTVLDTTALVHECYLRLARLHPVATLERRAFFAYAAQTMRSVIVDIARSRLAERRGGDQARITLDTALAAELPDPAGAQSETVLAVHQAMERLAEAEPRIAQLVELRYFGGFSDSEIAQTLGIAERTVRREWSKARGLLAALVGDGGA